MESFMGELTFRRHRERFSRRRRRPERSGFSVLREGESLIMQLREAAVVNTRAAHAVELMEECFGANEDAERRWFVTASFRGISIHTLIRGAAYGMVTEALQAEIDQKSVK